jgi:hypothetical protein
VIIALCQRIEGKLLSTIATEIAEITNIDTIKQFSAIIHYIDEYNYLVQSFLTGLGQWWLCPGIQGKRL